MQDHQTPWCNLPLPITNFLSPSIDIIPFVIWFCDEEKKKPLSFPSIVQKLQSHHHDVWDCLFVCLLDTPTWKGCLLDTVRTCIFALPTTHKFSPNHPPTHKPTDTKRKTVSHPLRCTTTFLFFTGALLQCRLTPLELANKIRTRCHSVC